MPDFSRRSLITGLISLVAAPAIVRAGSLMPIRVIEPALSMEQLLSCLSECYDIMNKNMVHCLFGDRLAWVDSKNPIVFGLPEPLHPSIITTLSSRIELDRR